MLVVMLLLGALAHRAPGLLPPFVSGFFGARGTGGDAAALSADAFSMQQLEMLRGVRPALDVRLTDADINAYIAAHPEALGLPKGFRAPRVSFGQGLIGLNVSTRVLLLPVTVHVALQPRVDDGRLQLSVVKVRAGRVSLPGEFRQQVERLVGELLNQRLREAGLEPMGVQVGEGELTISARLSP